MRLITNGVVIDDALKFVSVNKDKVKFTNNEIDHVIIAEETIEKQFSDYMR